MFIRDPEHPFIIHHSLINSAISDPTGLSSAIVSHSYRWPLYCSHQLPKLATGHPFTHLELAWIGLELDLISPELLRLLQLFLNTIMSYYKEENGGAKKSQLTCEVRTRIAYGVARGLEFLHTQGPDVYHGNIRSSNVLLTNSLDARLSDQGLLALIVLNAGYQAPEAGYAYDFSKKSDVYGFGVLLLGLLTSKAPFDAIGKNRRVDLPSWVRIMFQEKPIIDVFDKSMLQNYQEFGDQNGSIVTTSNLLYFEES
ncbi:hypothetical protein RND71_007194 [Anisodus tanguticus]|uniref:Protein kinase domain-containing protein n=1 Tax=Anisodus tanguticus TaxID=243964 RepID=A0AAE1SLE3_9SOLA|nr:hypothetical protein RND71_007194 [Anisodus tanguticus]